MAASASIARDPKLALLTLQIANEIDKVQAEQEPDPTIVAEFRELLSKKAGIEQGAGPARLSADAFTIGLLGRAVRATQAEPIRQIDQLVEILQRLIENLDPDSFRERRSNLDALKSFCLALHEAITASKASGITRDRAKTFNEIRVR